MLTPRETNHDVNDLAPVRIGASTITHIARLSSASRLIGFPLCPASGADRREGRVVDAEVGCKSCLATHSGDIAAMLARDAANTRLVQHEGLGVNEHEGHVEELPDTRPILEGP